MRQWVVINDKNVVVQVLDFPKRIENPTRAFFPLPEGSVFYDVSDFSDDVERGDIIYNGEHFPMPTFAVEFDTDIPGWVIDEAAALEHAKLAKITAIDTKTAELIKKGFAFKGERFSMSEAAQRNWIALSGGLANNMLPFPLAVSTVDEKSVILNSADELKMFLGAYMLYQSDPSQPLASGRVLKEAVTAATTIEEVNAVVDDRE